MGEARVAFRRNEGPVRRDAIALFRIVSRHLRASLAPPGPGQPEKLDRWLVRRRLLVDDRELDLANLLLRKDAVLARHAAHVARWHGVQAAALAMSALATLARLGETLASVGLTAAVGVSAVSWALAARRLADEERLMNHHLAHLGILVESLKSQGRP